MLEVQKINALIDDKQVIKDLSFSIKSGEVHVIMGPNGAGKSSFSKVIMGDPRYKITQGNIIYNNTNITKTSPSERFKMGIMTTFQSPVEIPGVSFSEFLYEAYRQSKEENDITLIDFKKKLFDLCERLDLNKDIVDRYINVGFSGGEKKKLEMLQVELFQPSCIVLDEIDSGIDVDGTKAIASMIKKLISPKRSIIIITHDNKLISKIDYNSTHVLINGTIVESGGRDLGEKIIKKGYASYGVNQFFNQSK